MSSKGAVRQWWTERCILVSTKLQWLWFHHFLEYWLYLKWNLKERVTRAAAPVCSVTQLFESLSGRSLLVCAIAERLLLHVSCSPWAPSVPSCVSFWKVQPTLHSGLRYLRMQCLAVRFQAACVGKGKWPTSPFTGCFPRCIQRHLFSRYLWKLCVSSPQRSFYHRPPLCLAHITFFPEEEICLWDRSGINFSTMSSQQNCICSMSLGPCQAIPTGRHDVVYGLQQSTLQQRCGKGNLPN